ncbi:hypothetical protein NE237_005880 [Protea cynaroides]|uniref:Uncharacterized protein n=1 Tax=Protea cynaroides TaxID=273540 RepID=A0A9Q0KM17_9MAGN|nr:hypothetical protein NE237_005880 [Protea cynaroides]
MEIRIDGHLAINVKHLHWKFRGNDSISKSKFRVEVYSDVHDWSFCPGLRHALFIVRPISLSFPPTPLSSQTASSSSLEGYNPKKKTELKGQVGFGFLFIGMADDVDDVGWTLEIGVLSDSALRYEHNQEN